MYNAQNLKNRIKNQAKLKNVLINDMLSECELSINAISQISDKKGLSCFPLARIADYLNCSVDYLLGRTDDPNVEKTSAAAQDEQQRELLALFDKLPESEKMKLIGRLEYMAEAAAKEAEQKNSSALYKYSSIAAEGGELSKSAKKKPKTTL